MIYGYIRVSSSKQTCEHQKYEIEQFAKQNKLKIDKWVDVGFLIIANKARKNRTYGLSKEYEELLMK